jgi:outer membrane receptor protein involved in Fe transport
MGKIKNLLVVLGIALGLQGFAQQEGLSIKGKVSNQAKHVVDAATVTLLKALDSSIVKTAITDASGIFEFSKLKPGNYLLQVTASGFNPYVSQPLELQLGKPALELPPFELSFESKELKGVVITGRKPFIEQKMDKMVVNVDAAVTNAGSNVLEVLEKSPGVTIDADGVIALKGKQQVLVMMDGRPTYLSPQELANLLKNMPASAVESIEIMTNPSAKYDAAGNSGVINIRTKKNKQKGFNGSISLNYGQGKYWRTNDNFNLNYRTGKFNFFANGGYSKWNGFNNLDIERNFRNANGDLDARLISESKMRNMSDNYTLKLGTDYYLSSKTTLGFVVSGFYNPEDFSSKNTSYLQDAALVTDSIVYAESSNNNLWKNGTLNLNMRHQFDSTGKELTMDLDYVRYRASSNQDFVNTTYNANWVKQNQEILRGDLPVNIDIYSAKADYSHPFKKGLKMDAGIKTSYVETNSSAFYYNMYSSGEQPDYSKTNSFLYKENINAAYVNFSKQIKKFGIQAGLRYEHTYIQGLQYGNPVYPDSSFTRSYGNLFPTLYISYQASKDHQWGINYGRRIDRPAYQDLNPFLFFLDKYTYQSGNPFIRPQYSDNIELSHTFKGFLTTTLNYGYTSDFMTETFEQEQLPNGDESYATIVRQGNIGQRHTAGIAVSAQVPVKKWWTAILYTNLNYNNFNGILNKERIDVEATNLLVNINNQFRFKKGWSGEISGWYRTKGVEGQIMIDPLGQLSLGVAKQILKEKGTLKLNVRDVLYTQVVHGNINFQSTEASFRQIRDSRVATFTFTYRFGKPIKGVKTRKTGGAGDEQNRVKIGNNN